MMAKSESERWNVKFEMEAWREPHHEFDLGVDVQALDEVGHEHDGTLEDANHDDALSLVLLVNLLRELTNAGLDGTLRHEDLLHVHHLFRERSAPRSGHFVRR